MWAEAELADRIDEFSELIASHLAALWPTTRSSPIATRPTLRDIRELTHATPRRRAAQAREAMQPGGRSPLAG